MHRINEVLFYLKNKNIEVIGICLNITANTIVHRGVAGVVVTLTSDISPVSVPDDVSRRTAKWVKWLQVHSVWYASVDLT